MTREKKREAKKLTEVGMTFFEDLSIPVSKQVKNWRAFLKQFRKEKEKQSMALFREINGFAADDDEAKRALVDALFVEHLQRYPKDDDERNEYTRSPNPMMMIGWRPSP